MAGTGIGMPYRALAQGLADPEGALANQYEVEGTDKGQPIYGKEVPGSSLHDYYMRLIGKTGESLGAAGMLPSQQLPKMPGWSGDALETPDSPDLSIRADSMRNAGLTKAVTGVLGQVPMTTWGARHGQKPGEYRTSPAGQAAIDMAEEPWKQEQERVVTANKIHAFHNQYAYLKSQAKTKDEAMIIDRAKDQATAAAFNDYTAGQLDLNRQRLKQQAASADFNAAARVRSLDQKDRQIGQGDDRLQISRDSLDSRNTDRELRRDADKKRLDILMQNAKFRQHVQEYGNTADWDKMQHIDSARQSLQDLGDFVKENPQVLNLSNKALHWSDVRLASNLGMRFDELRHKALENAKQGQRRMSNRNSAQDMEKELPMIGDDSSPAAIAQSIASIDSMRARFEQDIGGYEFVHPGMKQRTPIPSSLTDSKGNKKKAPAAAAAAPGGKTIDNMSDDELQTLYNSLGLGK